MCFSPKAPHDDSADQARAQEAAREARIAQGQKSIDDAFAQFDDPYFAGVQKSYSDYYTPQFDDQYTQALKKLQLALASRGLLESSAGATELGNFDKQANTKRTEIADNAIAAANDQRAKIAAEKATLNQQNIGAADPSAAAGNATAQAGILSAPQTYSPLGDLFSALLNTGTAVGFGQQQAGGPAWWQSGAPLSNPTGSAGSSRNVT